MSAPTTINESLKRFGELISPWVPALRTITRRYLAVRVADRWSLRIAHIILDPSATADSEGWKLTTENLCAGLEHIEATVASIEDQLKQLADTPLTFSIHGNSFDLAQGGGDPARLHAQFYEDRHPDSRSRCRSPGLSLSCSEQPTSGLPNEHSLKIELAKAEPVFSDIADLTKELGMRPDILHGHTMPHLSMFALAPGSFRASALQGRVAKITVAGALSLQQNAFSVTAVLRTGGDKSDRLTIGADKIPWRDDQGWRVAAFDLSAKDKLKQATISLLYQREVLDQITLGLRDAPEDDGAAIADAPLSDIGRSVPDDASPERERTLADRHIEKNCAELLTLALSLVQLARDEIEELDRERPNDPIVCERNQGQRELLLTFADGFDRIASALRDLLPNPSEPLLLGKAREVVNSIGQEINIWWTKNAHEAVDWCMRIPALGIGVGVLGLAGADMTVATSAIVALVGGPKVIDVVRSKKKSAD